MKTRWAYKKAKKRGLCNSEGLFVVIVVEGDAI